MNRFRKKYLEENPQQDSQDIQKTADEAVKPDSLRDYKELSEREQKIKKKIRLKERRRRFVLYGALFLLVVSVWSYIILHFYMQDKGSSDPIEESTLHETITTSKLFEDFIYSNFTKQSPERLNTIKLSGTIQMSGVEQEFVLYKKQPSMALLVLIYSNRGNITYGMDGEQVWQKVETQDGTTQVARVTGETAQGIKETGNFFSPFTQYVLTYNELDPILEINDKRDETGLIEVSFTNPYNGQKSLAKIDGQTFLIQELENIGKEEEILSTLYKDYVEVNGFYIPTKIENYSDGVLTQAVHIDKAATNIGILSEVFKTPSELGSSTANP